MSKLINEALCKQLVAEYFRRTRHGAEKPAVVLRELMQVTYSQGFTAAGASQAPASPANYAPLRARTPIASCIGCGCHDFLACLGGCWWLRVEYSKAVGVCSNCEAHVAAWDAGRRTPIGAQP